MLWILDLDGVIWLAGRPIPGSPEAVARLRAEGERLLFLTNNSGPTLGDYLEMLERAGVESDPSELVTSAEAAASMLDPGTRAAAIGGPGLFEALERRGVRLVAPSEAPEAVVLGRSVRLDYDELAAAAAALRAGARFVATNSDATFPTGDGLVPGTGALVAFLEVSSGKKPEVAGKPNQPAVELVKSAASGPALVVGDRPDTDGLFAERIGATFALVLTGVTGRVDLPVLPSPALVCKDLAAVVEQRLGSR